jgi:hypothetical protein
MKLAGEWLLKAMSENGEPSARRVVMVIGLLVFAPTLLVGMMRWASGPLGECFIAWVAICGGVYVGGSFANRPEKT